MMNNNINIANAGFSSVLGHPLKLSGTIESKRKNRFEINGMINFL